tara:strand:- start:25 stop:1509 length:1485 start_codon:yes stop_codon:yes gene_type:complete
MIVGIDLDNTIINYENSFKKIANSENIKIIQKFSKDYIKKKIKEKSNAAWTIIQGKIYGEKILEANLFKDFKKFLNFAQKNKIKLVIISHRTKYPIKGKKKNLHLCAKKFIDKNIGKKKFKIKKNLFFEINLNNKINRIKNNDCDYFIDDLPKVLNNKNFPKSTEGLLFNSKNKNLRSFNSWKNIINFFEKKIKENKYLDGKNNKCFSIKNNSIFVKQFCSNKFSDSYQKELKLSNFLNNNKINEIPKIINFSNKRKVVKYQFIHNTLLKKINKETILKNFRFIKKINKLKYTKENFEYASEFCKNPNKYYKEIYIRISKYKKTLFYKKNKRFKNLINSIEQKFLKLKNANYFVNFYNLKKKDLILSPCDFHIKNMIFNKKIYYFDFEYSGLDDPAKLYSVYFLQPENHVNINLFLSTINKILFFKKNNSLIKMRIIYLLPIIYLRWSLIILNEFNKKKFSYNKNIKELNAQIVKTSIYLKKRINYFNLYKFKN